MRSFGTIAALLLLVLASTSASAQNRIQTENSLSGSLGWQLSSPGIDREIERYASPTSVNIGNSTSFLVSTNDNTFNIDVLRTGWYGSLGGCLVKSVPNLPGRFQATSPPDSATGEVECNWQSNYTFSVPVEWTSGISLARLTSNQSGKQSYLVFVVRDDLRPSKLLFEFSYTGSSGTHGVLCSGGTFKPIDAPGSVPVAAQPTPSYMRLTALNWRWYLQRPARHPWLCLFLRYLHYFRCPGNAREY